MRLLNALPRAQAGKKNRVHPYEPGKQWNFPRDPLVAKTTACQQAGLHLLCLFVKCKRNMLNGSLTRTYSHSL